jgi:hypothetical protein
VDVQNFVSSNLSGLVYTGSGTAGRLWAVDNGPGTLYRLFNNGTNWVPDTTGDGNWSAGKALRYTDGTGDPDSEGVTIGGDGGVYVSTERDNNVPATSKLAVLRFDPTATGSPINATAQWDLTSAIPPTGSNLGLEAITYIPDSFLVSHGLKDSSTNAAYDPATYPNHGSGLYFVGVEGSGTEYGFALDGGGSTFHLVTQFTSGFSTIMENNFDASSGYFWAHCDNTCANASHVLLISPTTGTFAVAASYDPPSGMDPTENNEGFATTSDADCVGGLKPVFWSDDGAAGGFSLRQGSLNCTISPPPSLSEFPSTGIALAAVVALVAAVGAFVARRRVRLTARG